MWKKKILFSIILLVIKLLYPNGNKKEYKKTHDRWTRYVNRPKRDVFYLGIDSI